MLRGKENKGSVEYLHKDKQRGPGTGDSSAEHSCALRKPWYILGEVSLPLEMLHVYSVHYTRRTQYGLREKDLNYLPGQSFTSDGLCNLL